MSEITKLPTPDLSVLDAAVLYTELGWPVIRVYGVTDRGQCLCPAGVACKTPGKHPIGNKWAEKAAKTPDEARDLFRSHVGNIGIPVPPHIVVVDVDRRETVEEWARKGLIMPDTLVAISGSKRGYHALFTVTLEQRAKLKNKKIAEGVDIRSGHDKVGQIVVAPSRHASGGQYEWGPPAEIAPLPDWLFEICVAAKSKPTPRTLQLIPGGKSKGYAAATIEGVCADIAQAQEGERNNVLFSKATHAFEVLLSRGLDPEGHMDPIADAARSIGLDDHEIQKTLDSALRTARESPSSAPHIPVMPVDPTTSDPKDAWKSELIRRDDQSLVKCYQNAALILRHGTDLEWNLLTETPEWRGAPLTDARLGELREQVFGVQHRFPIALDMLWQAVVQVATERAYHPVRRYLEPLTWDGEPRIHRVMSDILGHAAPADSDQAMIRAWLISAVARVMSPGCKADSILVLVGPQGYFKSTFFDALASPWFSDTLVTPTTDGALRLRRTWITELAEIDQLTAGFDAAKIKAFITARSDVLRRPYGRVTESLDRHSVFAGTTNETHFLTAETGTRRFWCISVDRPVQQAQARAWRDQLWAEALHAYRAGEPWWLGTEVESQRAQAAEAYVAHDPWEGVVAEWLQSRQGVPVTTAQVMMLCLQVDHAQADLRASKRLGRIMRRLGRKYQSVRVNGNLGKGWL
jgi:Virulence-associated protein E/Bifunctional DNA primase/polymerase, N-terminal